jgi:hypothetical protein
MATLKTNTLTGTSTAGSIAVTGEGNSTTTNLQQGLNKAWCHWDMTDSAHPEYTSFNIASTTDKATGETTLTFTNNMGGANWGATFFANTSSGDGDSQFGAGMSGNVALRTTTGYLFECFNGSSMLDSKHCDSHTVGDLA